MNAKHNLAALLAVAGGLTLIAGPANASVNPCGGDTRSPAQFPSTYGNSMPQVDEATLAAEAAERAARKAARKAAREAAKAAKAAAQEAAAAEATSTQPTATQR